MGIARHLSINFPQQKPQENPFQVTAGSILRGIDETKKFLPQVEKLRKDIFGKVAPPLSWIKAIKWLREEEHKEFLEWKRKSEEQAGGSSELEKKREDIEKQIHSLLKEYEKIMPGRIELNYKTDVLPYPGKKGWRELIKILPGTTLEKILNLSKEIANNTALLQESIMMWILSGVPPVRLSCNLSKILKLNRPSFKIEIFRTLKYKEFMALYWEAKKFFKNEKDFTEKQLELYMLIKNHGGEPGKKKMEFWRKMCFEWEKNHPENKFANSRCIRMAYKRLKKHLSSKKPTAGSSADLFPRQ
jgi:hypothetical protein